MSVIFCSLRSAHSRLPVWACTFPFWLSLRFLPLDQTTVLPLPLAFSYLASLARLCCFFFLHWSTSLFTFSLRRAWVIPRQVLQMESTSLFLNLINSFVFRKSLHTVKCTQLKCVVQWVLITGYVQEPAPCSRSRACPDHPQRESLFLLSVNFHPSPHP